MEVKINKDIREYTENIFFGYGDYRIPGQVSAPPGR